MDLDAYAATIYDTTQKTHHTRLSVYRFMDEYLNSIGVYHLSTRLPRLLHDS